jgi:MoaA/NifB/PqqE/SkfB family radical SAM enzyme
MGGGLTMCSSNTSPNEAPPHTLAGNSPSIFVPRATRERAVYPEMKAMENRHFARLNFFQDAIAQGKPNNWRCRAGARYMYICEDGLVHYCSQQRGYPAKPLEEYTREDIRREYLTEKPCAPYCTVSCVHYISYFDFFRAPQTLKSGMPMEQPQQLVKITKSGV